MEIPTQSSQQFVNDFALRPKHFAWFFGAGASVSAGIPTGYMMIQDFKTRIFCQENKLPRDEVDSNDPLWKERIEIFFQRSSILPPADDPSEYSAAFEAIYPKEEQRRLYIDKAIQKGTPSFGHRVLASLISTRNTPCIFTTNFDSLIETSATITGQLLPVDQRASLTVAALDSVDRAERCLHESDWPLLAKLHGDYQSVQLKNTEKELAEQDKKMRTVLTSACQRFGLVIVGYSGRDVSVMNALSDALQGPHPYPQGIYWVTSSRNRLIPAVKDFLELAIKSGVNATIVEAQNFDELMGDISNWIDIPAPLKAHINENKIAPKLPPATVPTRAALKNPVLRMSAIPIQKLPTIARLLKIKKTATTREIRDLLRASNTYGAVASLGEKVAAFGSDERLLKALAPLDATIAGTVELLPEKNSWALGLLYDALIFALCRNRPFIRRMRSSGHAILVAPQSLGKDREIREQQATILADLRQAYRSPLNGTVQKHNFPFYEGIQINLSFYADRWWCVFEPYTQVDIPKTEEEISSPHEKQPYSGDPAGDWRRERWASRYNRNWERIIEKWSQILGKEGATSAFAIPEGAGINATFQLIPITAWSRPAHTHSYFTRG